MMLGMTLVIVETSSILDLFPSNVERSLKEEVMHGNLDQMKRPEFLQCSPEHLTTIYMLESRYIDGASADVRRGMYERIRFRVLSWTNFPMLELELSTEHFTTQDSRHKSNTYC